MLISCHCSRKYTRHHITITYHRSSSSFNALLSKDAFNASNCGPHSRRYFTLTEPFHYNSFRQNLYRSESSSSALRQRRVYFDRKSVKTLIPRSRKRSCNKCMSHANTAPYNVLAGAVMYKMAARLLGESQMVHTYQTTTIRHPPSEGS